MSCHPVFQCYGHTHGGNNMELTNVLIRSLVFKYMEEKYQDFEINLDDKLEGVSELISINSSEIEKSKLDTNIAVTPTNIGQIEVSQSIYNSHVLLPEQFGAVGDGVKDDTLAFQKFMDSGGTLNLKRGSTYRITNTVIGKSNTYIKGNGATIFTDLPLVSRKGTLGFAGTESNTATTFTSAYSKKEVNINTLSSLGFSIGDDIMITTTEYKHGVEGQSGNRIKYKGEFNKIKNIIGNKIELMYGLKDDYSEGIKTITKLDMLENIKISEVTFINNEGFANTVSTSQDHGARAIHCEYVRNIDISNNCFSNYRRMASQSSACIDVNITDNFFEGYDIKDVSNQPDGSEWFNSATAESCEGVVFKGNYTVNSRRAFDTDSYIGKPFSRNIVMSNNISENCKQSLGTHSSENIVISSNIGDSGIGVRAIDVLISNNQFKGGCYVGNQGNESLPSNFRVGHVILKGNTFELEGVDTIAVRGSCDSVNISDNVIISNHIGIELVGSYMDNITIANNNIVARYEGIRFPHVMAIPRLSMDNLKIVGNYIRLREGGNGITIAGAVETNPARNTVISGNTIDNASNKGINFGSRNSTETTGWFTKPMTVSHNIGVNCTFASAGYFIAPLNEQHLPVFIGGATNYVTDMAVKQTLEIEGMSSPHGSIGKTVEVGARAYNPNVGVDGILGYVCTVAGTRVSGSPVANGSISAGSDELTVISNNKEQFTEGSYIALAGSGLGASTYVVKALGNKKYLLSNKATTKVTSGDLTFVSPTFKPLGYVDVAGGGFQSGFTVSRPTGVTYGHQFFDRTLGIPVFYKGSSEWVNASGEIV